MATTIVREIATLFKVKTDKKSVDRALQAISKIKNAAVAVGAAVAGAKAVDAIKDLSEEIAGIGDDVRKLSTFTTVSTDALQELGFVAERSGVSFNVMSGALRELKARLAIAARDTSGGTVSEAFGIMGINAVKAGKDIEGTFLQVVDFIDSIDDSGEKFRLLGEVFGGSGKELIKVVKGGSAAINEMRQEARALGGVFGEELLTETEAYRDSQARLSFAIRGVKNEIGRRGLIFNMRRLSNTMLQFVKVNRGRLGAFLGKGLSSLVRSAGNEFSSLSKIFNTLIGDIGTAGLNSKSAKFLAVVGGLLTKPSITTKALGIIVLKDAIMAIIQALTGVEIQKSAFFTLFEKAKTGFTRIMAIAKSFKESFSISNFLPSTEDLKARFNAFAQSIKGDAIAFVESIIDAGIASAVPDNPFFNKFFGIERNKTPPAPSPSNNSSVLVETTVNASFPNNNPEEFGEAVSSLTAEKVNALATFGPAEPVTVSP